MILYHGSNIVVEKPKILQPDRRLDFGTGFYLTSSYEQAEILSSLKVLHFEGASVEWLKFVANNRNIESFADDSDIVIGPVANDRTMPVIGG